MFLGRAIANSCQRAMILYAANPNTVLSPPIILTLGTVTFCVSMLDVMIEFVFIRKNVAIKWFNGAKRQFVISDP
jgi:hypothetical protein